MTAVFGFILAAAALAAAAFLIVYLTRFRTMAGVERLTDYADGYDLYRMDVKYGYSLDRLIARGITDDRSFADAVVKEALPLLPVTIKAPSFACTAFTLRDADGHVHMGRNYDFKNDTSAMLVRCAPKDGYRSIAFTALDNVSANRPNASLKKRFAALTAPFICLDGMNEKGVSIAVLTLDSKPTDQNTGRPKIATSLAIRLVLDRAATTAEAVALLGRYDMLAASGRDYHFYITDASGDGRVVEYDCESGTRETKVTPTAAVTNFYILYKDKVLPNRKNGIYGHGRERYDAVQDVFAKEADRPTEETVWEALRAAAQEPRPDDITSNTQWSADFDDTARTVKIVIRRNWADRIACLLEDGAARSR